MKRAKFAAQLLTGLLMAFVVMGVRGLFDPETTLSGKVMAISDGFSVTGLLYIGMGSLMWVSTTGLFDIFAYAVRKGAHGLIPGMVKDTDGDYYSYKMDKKEKRKPFSGMSSLVTGAVFVIISVIFTVVWYNV